MNMMTKRFRAIGLVAALVGSGLVSGCATEDYVDKQIATVNARIDQTEQTLNGRIDAVDQKATEALRRADEANQKADAALARPTAVRRAGERG